MNTMPWWQRPRVRACRGDLVTTRTRSTIRCPACADAPVVYNGNYFCDNDCGWALAHPAETRRDRLVCDLIGIDYA